MQSVTALGLRQSLGKVLRQLQKGGEPIIVERNREAAAVLISLRDFSERFADKRAMAAREQLVREIHAFRAAQKLTTPDAVTILREARSQR